VKQVSLPDVTKLSLTSQRWPGTVRCENQELRTIVSEQSDQALSWCKSQVHMFEGDLIGFDKLEAHH
jgi:hypothetical protein